MEQKSFWWEADKDEVHKSVFSTISHWDIKQSQRSEENLRNFRLYGNSEVLGLRVGEFQRVRSLNKLTLNVIQSAIDTATSKIAKQKPKPAFLTEDGQWEMARKARNLEKYVYGTFYNMNLYQKGVMVFRDGCVFGDGLVHFYPEDEQIRAERVFPEEIVVDEDEAAYGEPRQIHRVKFMSKGVLAARFPRFRAQIEASSVAMEHGSYMYSEFTPDIIRVVESWKLPDSDKKPGRHCICVDKATLLCEDYTKEYFPFEKWSWNPRLLGYWSQGISEQLTGIQIEINKLLKTIQLAMHLGCVPKIFVQAGSEIVKSHLNNMIGGIVTYAGEKPTSEQLMNVPPELFLQLDRLYQKAFEIIGLSEMSVAARKPAGLESGKALREFHDIESERFAVVAQSWEDFYMRCAKKIILMSKDLAEENPDLAIKYVGEHGMRKIKFKDVNLEEDAFVMKVYPKNLLSDTPAGRLADVQELFGAGFLNQRQALSLLDYPDIKSITSLETAIVRDIDATIEDIIDEGIYNPPEEMQDLEYALPIMQSAYLKYKRQGLPEERLDLFIQWIDDALTIINPPEQEMMDEELEAEMAMGEEQMPGLELAPPEMMPQQEPGLPEVM